MNVSPLGGAPARSQHRGRTQADMAEAVRRRARPPTTVIDRNPSSGPKSSDAVDWIPVREGVRNEVSQSCVHPVTSIMVAVYAISRVDTSSTSAATATACDATPNSPRPSTRPPPGPSPRSTQRSGEQRHDGRPDSIGSPRSGRSAPSARAPPKCALFNAKKCAVFRGH